MRSLLFVPADAPAKLEKGLGCGADAIIVDLEDSIAPERKAAAREQAAAFLSAAVRRPARPRLLVRVNGLATGLTDADLDAVIAARPDAIMLPKAEGGASIMHADAKLATREALAGLPDGHVKIVAIATETAQSLFVAGTYRAASPRLTALTWGAEDLSAELGAEANRDAEGRFLDPYRLARTLCLAAAAAAEVLALDTVYVDFRNERGAAPRMRGGAPRRLPGQDGDPSRASRDHQRRLHAEARGGRAGEGDRRGLRRRARRRRRRHRRRHVRPPAFDQGAAAHRAGRGCGCRALRVYGNVWPGLTQGCPAIPLDDRPCHTIGIAGSSPAMRRVAASRWI